MSLAMRSAMRFMTGLSSSGLNRSLVSNTALQALYLMEAWNDVGRQGTCVHNNGRRAPKTSIGANSVVAAPAIVDGHRVTTCGRHVIRVLEARASRRQAQRATPTSEHDRGVQAQLPRGDDNKVGKQCTFSEPMLQPRAEYSENTTRMLAES